MNSISVVHVKLFKNTLLSLAFGKFNSPKSLQLFSVDNTFEKYGHWNQLYSQESPE